MEGMVIVTSSGAEEVEEPASPGVAPAKTWDASSESGGTSSEDSGGTSSEDDAPTIPEKGDSKWELIDIVMSLMLLNQLVNYLPPEGLILLDRVAGAGLIACTIHLCLSALGRVPECSTRATKLHAFTLTVSALCKLRQPFG
jgi:hypothetical protein